MKKILWFLSLGLILYSCDSKPEYYTISGKVKNANGEKLYLIELQSNNTVFLDSIILNNEGVFSFKGQTDIPKFYALRISPNNYLTLIVNPYEQIVIKTDGKNLAENPIIEGSPESQKIMKLRTNLNNSVRKLDSLGMYYRSLIGTKELAKVRDSLNLASKEIVEKHQTFTKNFIEENLNSLASLMALYQQIAPRRYVLNPKDDFKYFAMVDSSLMSLYPQSDAVRALHSQMEEIKRQQNADSDLNNALNIGKVAPDIVLPNPEGDTIALSSLKGQYVLVDFWASWCRPCRMENPNLVINYTKYHDKGFEIFQVSLDKKKESWVDAIKSDQLTWTQVSDLQYWNSHAAQLYHIQAIPANFLLDKNGKIIAKNLRGDALEAKLSEIFD